MPIRLVREGINSSPRINSLSRGAELFYRRLMSVVDDYGRFHGSPATLRGACWPTCPEAVSEDEVRDWLEECLQVHSKCLAVDEQSLNPVKPLVLQYISNGSKFIQLTDFKQQTRSKSKFPEPAKHLLSKWEADESKMPGLDVDEDAFIEDEDEDVNGKSLGKKTSSQNSWNTDKSFSLFSELYRRFWPRVMDDDLESGWIRYWSRLGTAERISATKNLRARIDAGEDGEFVKHMPDYLKSEWKRGPKVNGHANGTMAAVPTKPTYPQLPVYKPGEDS